MVDLRTLFICLLSLSALNTIAHEKDKSTDCVGPSIKCAKTVTSAYSPNGDLWRLWTFQKNLYYTISPAGDLSKSKNVRIDNVNEKISARGENRPKIGFDKNNGVYISWAKKREKRFTADIRFIYSLDYGKNFSNPKTINDDNLLAGHSFNEMLVNTEGEVSLVWLDSRKKAQAKLAGKEPETQGSEIYFARGLPAEDDLSFKNKKVASSTCQCCRLSFTQNPDVTHSVFWRQIFGDNIREFALINLSDKQTIKRISYDEWKINGCPHQGGALSIDSKGRHYMVWFNQGSKGKGVFFSYSDDNGDSINKPLSIGNLAKKASHPHLNQNGERVDIVWLEFNGGEQELWHQFSINRGENFSEAKLIDRSKLSADRPFIISYKNKSYISWQKPKSEHLFKAL